MYDNLKQMDLSGTLSTILTTSQGKVDGNGNQASFDNPWGIYFDSSSKDLMIVDNYYFSIRKMNQSGLRKFDNTEKKKGLCNKN